MIVNENIDIKIRKQALDLIEVIFRCRKDLVRNKGHYNKMLQEIINFAATDFDDESKSDMVDSSMGALDSIVNNCDINMLYKEFITVITDLTKSEQTRKKAACYCAIGVVSGACHEVMR